MQHLLDMVLVGLLLLLSLAYAVWVLGPKSWRRRGAARLARLTPYMPARFGVRRVAQRWSERLAAKSTGSCGGCDDCGSAVGDPAAQSAAHVASGGDVRVSPAQIGRRDSLHRHRP